MNKYRIKMFVDDWEPDDSETDSDLLFMSPQTKNDAKHTIRTLLAEVVSLEKINPNNTDIN